MINRRFHIFLLVFALVVTIIVTWLYFHIQEVISNTIESTASARSIILNDQIDRISQDNVLQIYNSTAADRTKLKSVMIPSDQILSFIQTLETLGPKSGADVTVSSIGSDLSDNSLPGKRGTISVHIEVKGSWATVMKALILSENLPFESTIDGVGLSGSIQDQGKVKVPVWNISFNLKAMSVVPNK